MTNEKLSSRTDRLTLHDSRIAMMERLRTTRHNFLTQLSPAMLGFDEETLIQAKQKAEEGNISEAIRLLGNGIRVDRFVELLQKFAADVGSVVPRNSGLLLLAEELSRDHELAGEFVRSVIENREESICALANRFELEEELLRFVAETPLVPLFRNIASVYVGKEMNLNACPVCARKFSVGCFSIKPPPGWDHFSGTRRRYMICLLCGTSVPTNEIWCPRCWPSEIERVGFIQMKDEPYLLIDYCTKCSTYVKMIDIDAVGKPEDPLVLDYSTLDLDGVARDRRLKSALGDW